MRQSAAGLVFLVTVETPGELALSRRLLAASAVAISQSLNTDGSVLLQYTVPVVSPSAFLSGSHCNLIARCISIPGVRLPRASSGLAVQAPRPEACGR